MKKIERKSQVHPLETSSPDNGAYGSATGTGPEIMVTLDSDGQHNLDETPRIVEPILNEGIDVVIGSRFLGDRAN